ncbi:MAG: DnaB-like helicase C-terminal domain-containing protein [Alphaproteobacteria bacterium]
MALSESAAKWAKDRGIGASTLERLGAVSGTVPMPPDHKHCEVIAFPYRRGAEVVNVKYRALSTKAFRQREGGEQRFFNLDRVLGAEAESIYVVEGELDVCAMVECGFPVESLLSPPNGAPAQASAAPGEQDRYRYVRDALGEGLSRFRRFVLVTDNDPPGQALRQDLVRLLGAARCWFVDWPAGIKDANDALLRWGAADTRLFIEDSARPWPVEGLYRLSELPEPEPMTVWRPGFPEWESKLAFAPGTVCVATGHPGHGKTTLLTQCWFNVARDYGFAIAMASFETRAKPHQRRNLRQFMYGRLDRSLTDVQIAHADRWIDEHFLWIEHPNRRPTIRWVLDMAEVAVVRHGAKVLSIDPWNRLESSRPDGMRETDYISQCLDELLDFARQMRVCVQVTAHPAKAMEFAQRKSHPVLEDIAGSKAWDTKADLGLCVHRPVVFKDGQRQTEAQLYVLKSRFEELGYPCRLDLEFDLSEGRFRSVDYRTAAGVAA